VCIVAAGATKLIAHLPFPGFLQVSGQFLLRSQLPLRGFLLLAKLSIVRVLLFSQLLFLRSLLDGPRLLPTAYMGIVSRSAPAVCDRASCAHTCAGSAAEHLLNSAIVFASAVLQ